jgi:hypothetical protein
MPILAGIVLVRTLAPSPLLQTHTNAATNPTNPTDQIMAAVKLIVANTLQYKKLPVMATNHVITLVIALTTSINRQVRPRTADFKAPLSDNRNNIKNTTLVSDILHLYPADDIVKNRILKFKT